LPQFGESLAAITNTRAVTQGGPRSKGRAPVAQSSKPKDPGCNRRSSNDHNDRLDAHRITLLSLAVLFGVRPCGGRWSAGHFRTYKRILPQMSDTERDALEAGTVWWDGELFRGKPDWNKLLAYPVPKLSAEEQSFMDNEVEEACALVDDWQVTHELYDLPPKPGATSRTRASSA
jgi:hypothetical protein